MFGAGSGTYIFSGGGGGSGGAVYETFVNASPTTDGTPGQVFTTPSGYIPGSLTAWAGSVMIVNADITELSANTFSFTSFTPIAGQTIRVFYKVL